MSSSPLSDPTGAAQDRHAVLHGGFRWHVPARFNIAQACCTRWAQRTPQAVAIRWEHEDGRRAEHRYIDLERAARALARALAAMGVQRGDRVAIVMPQRFETAVAHMAVYRLGAVAMPLSMLFGPEALQYRLDHSRTRVAIVDESAIEALRAARAGVPGLATVVAVGGAAGRGDVDWDDLLRHGSRGRAPFVDTAADDPAVLIYTSGTTGPPKGALIPHRALIGNLTGFVCSQNWFGFGDAPPAGEGMGADARHGHLHGHVGDPSGSDAVFWSPADWAWTGGLMDALLPTLYFGREIVAFQGRFTPERAFDLMVRHGVTHTFLFPTALKAMRRCRVTRAERIREGRG